MFWETYGWSFEQALLFGAIISATGNIKSKVGVVLCIIFSLLSIDPVAVVAILRELGTSETLSVMIEGESLLNDGVAILLYEILKDMVEYPGADQGTWKITKQFIQIAIGGPIYGYLMGKVSIWCLTMVYNDAATEITITLGTGLRKNDLLTLN